MGTKNKPALYDCYANADPDEPMFVLLGRDVTGWAIVTLWVKVRQLLGEDVESDKLLEARACARAMEDWARKLGKGDRVNEVHALVATALAAALPVAGKVEHRAFECQGSCAGTTPHGRPFGSSQVFACKVCGGLQRADAEDAVKRAVVGDQCRIEVEMLEMLQKNPRLSRGQLVALLLPIVRDAKEAATP